MSIEKNSVVSMSYELKDAQTGEVIDSNVGGEPLSFILGMGHIIPGLEKEIEKLSNGERATITVAPADAYGEYDAAAVQTLPKEQFAGIELAEGMTLFGQGDGGQSVQVVVKSFNDESVTIDFNHPLAGKELVFDIDVTDVRDATADELASGYVGGKGGCCGGGCGDHGHSHDDEHECCGGEHHKDGGGCCGSH